MTSKDTMIAMWVCGFVLGALLMVVDELINLSQSCGQGAGCFYPIPFLGLLSIWDSWTLVFIAILLTVFLTLVVMETDKK
jgi:hypothetical protein